MRSSGKILCLLLALLILAALALPVCAAEYTYTVRLFAGNCGTINGQQVVVIDGLHYGDRVTFRLEDVQVEASSKYYVRGFRESGRDNDTVGAASFVVTGDRDYVVAYGVKGNLVAYTVRYLDSDGKALLAESTFYGNVGDKPVVAYRYVDGYQPRYYNVTRTLSENAAENIFTFYYDKLTRGAGAAADSRSPVGQSAAETWGADTQQATTPAAPTGAPAPQASTPVNSAPPETEGAAGIAAASPGAEILRSPADHPTEDREVAEILDLDAPQDGAAEAIAAKETPMIPIWLWVLTGALGLGLLILLIALRKRKPER